MKLKIYFIPKPVGINEIIYFILEQGFLRPEDGILYRDILLIFLLLLQGYSIGHLSGSSLPENAISRFVFEPTWQLE